MSNLPTPKNWISEIPDQNTRICNLSIPGTHDSGAQDVTLKHTGGLLAIGAFAAKTQDEDISGQLDMGIRFLDIRVGNDGESIMHGGAFSCNLGFGSVVRQCKSFLDAHPGEFILMSVKQEEDTAIGRTLEENYFSKDAIFWKDSGNMPRICEVAGKIVILRRYSESSNYGIAINRQWPDNNRDFWVTTVGNSGVQAQDLYDLSVDEMESKTDAVKKYLFDALADSRDTLFLNFTSATGKDGLGIPNPSRAAQSINPWLKNFLADHQEGKLGVVIMDFPTYVLSRFIYRTNFKLGEHGVVLYRDADFRGDSESLPVGRYNHRELLLPNDSLSSLKVRPGFKVTLYEDANFTGNSRVILADTPSLLDFNDQTSSVEVEAVPVHETPVTAAILYTDSRFNGDGQPLSVGRYRSSDLRCGNDSLSSVKVTPGYKVTLYEDGDFKGKTRVLTSDTPTLGDWNDETSSVVIEKA